MNIGSLYASFGIDISSMSKDVSKVESMFKELGGSLDSISEDAEEGILKLFKQKMPDAFNAMQQKFLAMQDETQSFVDYIRNNMPGAFQKMAVEFFGASEEMKNGMKESESAVDGVAGTVEILKTALANMNMASEKRKALLDEEIASLVELQIRRQAAYDPEELIKYDNEIKNVQKRIQLLTDKTSEFKDVSLMSLGEMKLELHRLRNTPLELASPGHMAAVKQRMAELTESVGNYGKELRAQGDTTQRFITTVQGIIGVVQGVTGTLALFGVENENVEKTMLAFMNVSQALSTIHDLNEKGILKEIAARMKNTFAIGAETTALKTQAALNVPNKSASIKGVDVNSLKVVSTEAGKASKSILGMSTSMLSAGASLGIFAVGIAAIGFAVYKIVDSYKASKQAQENWTNAMDLSKSNIADFRTQILELNNSIQDLQLQYSILTGSITEENGKLIQNEVDLNRSIESKRKEFSKRLVQLEQAKNDAIKAIRNELDVVVGVDQAKKNAEDRAKRIKDIEIGTQKEIAKETALYYDLIGTMTAEFNTKQLNVQAEAAKRRQEEARQAWQTYLNEYKTWTQKIQDMQDDMIVSDEAREITKLQRRRDREIEDLNLSKLNAEQKGQMILTIADYYLRQENAIHDKYSKQRADDAEQARQAEIAKVEQYYDDLNAKMDDAEQKRNDLVNTYLTLRSQNETLSHQERIKALEKLEEIRYKEEQEKYKGQTAILEELAIQHTQNMAAINKTTFEGETAAIDWAERWKEAGTQAAQAMESAAESMITSMAEMIGKGGATAADFGKMVLGTLADLAITVGKIAIATGISIAGIKKALESLNPVAAVAAGAALVALGIWAKGALAGAAEDAAGSTNAYTNLGGAGLMQGLATGGTVTKAGAFIVGEKGPEMVNLPGRASVTPNDMLGIGDLVLTTNISGSDLQIILQRAAAKSKRG